MTLAITGRARGRHTPAHRIAELRRALNDLEDQNSFLARDGDAKEQDLHTALMRGCQDAMRIAQLREQLAGAVAGIRKTQQDLIRAKAEQERLRRAVVNARPRIREVDTQLVRPYSPVVVLPYVSPVPHRDTSNDQTQELPILDRP